MSNGILKKVSNQLIARLLIYESRNDY